MKLSPFLHTSFILLLGMGIATSCKNDDTDFFSQYSLDNDDTEDDDNTASDDSSSASASDTIFIAWSGSSATVTGDSNGYVTVSGADVTVIDTESANTMVLSLSGSTTDGSLLVYRSLKYTILLNGVSITNTDGPAINNQCSKSLYVVCADGTTNTLTDGTAYATQTFQQKGTLFSEGQIYFSGAGTLNVNGNYKNAIACDDYITVTSDITINATTAASGTNGIKVNDGMFINGGTLNINVASDGGRGISSNARTTVTGGTTTITTTGDCFIETVDNVTDTTSAAGIKSDSLFTMTGGSLTITSTGDGGKGIRCNENVEISGGTLTVKTTGSNDDAKPKAIKSDTGIIISGGSLTATVRKSWACDNGSDSDTPADRLTIVGTPTTSDITKKSVVIVF